MWYFKWIFNNVFYFMILIKFKFLKKICVKLLLLYFCVKIYILFLGFGVGVGFMLGFGFGVYCK